MAVALYSSQTEVLNLWIHLFMQWKAIKNTWFEQKICHPYLQNKEKSLTTSLFAEQKRWGSILMSVKIAGILKSITIPARILLARFASLLNDINGSLMNPSINSTSNISISFSQFHLNSTHSFCWLLNWCIPFYWQDNLSF